MEQQPTPATDLHWYALRAFWNKTQQLVVKAQQAGWRTYVAVGDDNKPLIPSLFFVQTTEAWVKAFRQSHFGDLMVYMNAAGSAPAVIRDREMEVFMLVTSVHGHDAPVEVLEPKPQYAQGDLVRVTEGLYKGAIGIVKRIRKDRKLVIAVSGVAVVAISHIPLCFLEKVESE